MKKATVAAETSLILGKYFICFSTNQPLTAKYTWGFLRLKSSSSVTLASTGDRGRSGVLIPANKSSSNVPTIWSVCFLDNSP